MATFEITADDLSDAATRDLLALHLRGMQQNSPAGSVFALDLSGLQALNVSVWTARDGAAVIGVGALKLLGGGAAEIKSMRTHPLHLRRGVGTAILERLITEARLRGVTTLSLETGSGAAFEPALALYRRRGFANGGAFGAYEPSGFNQFLHLSLPP